MKIWLTGGLLLTLCGCGAAPTLRVIDESSSPDSSDTRVSQLKRPARGEEWSLPIHCPANFGAARAWLALRSKKIHLKIDCAVPTPNSSETGAIHTEMRDLTFNGALPRRGNGVVVPLKCPQKEGLTEIKLTLGKDDFRGVAKCASGASDG